LDNNSDEDIYARIPDNFHIRLPNNIYDNLSITNEELTILTLMYRNYMKQRNIGLCSIEILAKLMRVDISKNRKIITTINDSISGLVEKNYIIKLYNLHYELINADVLDRDTLFYVELVEPPDDFYFVVHDRDIDSIFKYMQSLNIGKFGMIRYFIACRRVANNQNNFGYLTQGKLKSLVTDSRTIGRYNKILQDDLKLIIYNNSYLTEDKHYCTTYIGKQGEEEDFNHNLQNEVSSKGLIHTDKVKSNKKRSTQQKINKNVDSLSVEELEALLIKKKALEYKEPDPIIEDIKPKTKHLGKKKKVVEIVPEPFDDWFQEDEDENTHELTEAEQILNQEIINANYDLVPEEVHKAQLEEMVRNEDNVVRIIRKVKAS